MAKKWLARNSRPADTNKYYLKTTHGGYNKCILGNPKMRACVGSVLANCVGYAYGRFMEIGGTRAGGITTCKLPTCNAEDWYLQAMPYTKSKTPSLGAVICFSLGNTGQGSDGAGHVAIVEGINYDKNGNPESLFISESGYSSFIFRTNTIYYRNGVPTYSTTSKLKFQGFIANPWAQFNYDEEDDPTPTPTPTPTPDPDPERVIFEYDPEGGETQRGRVTFNMRNGDENTTLTATVKFKTPFKSKPRIFTCVNTSKFTSDAHPSNVSTDGFTIYFRRSDLANTSVDWLAVGDF